jgi:hypothetical protein
MHIRQANRKPQTMNAVQAYTSLIIISNACWQCILIAARQERALPMEMEMPYAMAMAMDGPWHAMALPQATSYACAAH